METKKIATPRHDANAPGALVMPRPSATHQVSAVRIFYTASFPMHVQVQIRKTTTLQAIFRVLKSLTFKTRLSNDFYVQENKKSHFQVNGFAVSLALKQRLRATRKCPIGVLPFSLPSPQSLLFLVPVRRLSRPSRSMHFGDVPETKNSLSPRDPKRVGRAH